MKSRDMIIIVIVVALLLISAQVFFGKSAQKKATSGAIVPTRQEPASVAAQPDLPEVSGPVFPDPEQVTGIDAGIDGEGIRLVRGDAGWVVANHGDIPADQGKIARFLAVLLQSDTVFLDAAASETKTGLEDDGGLLVLLRLAGDELYPVRIGLHADKEYASSYVAFPGNGVARVAGDVRGALGLWKNRADAQLDVSAWIETQVLRFNPAEVNRIEASYPDHSIVFKKNAAASWEPASLVPGGEWSLDGLMAWLEDLSEFRVAGVADGAVFSPDSSDYAYDIMLSLASGETKSIHVQPTHAGNGMIVSSSDLPNWVFHLPEWRFKKYFMRLATLFPKAVPTFDLSELRVLDVKRRGSNVKLSLRDNRWSAVAVPYPLLPAQVERFARYLSSWRPEDYAVSGTRNIVPAHGESGVSVILASGIVHEYRLAGRHPLFHWRYVEVDGATVFAITDAEARVMFPEFTDILDMGKVFDGIAPSELDRFELRDGEDVPVLLLSRNPDGTWTAEGKGQHVVLPAAELEHIIGDVMQWRVAGFYSAGDKPVAYRVLIGDHAGQQVITLLQQPDGRDIPYLTENGKAFLADRTGFTRWFALVHQLKNRLQDMAAAAEQAEIAAAAAVQKAEQETEQTGEVADDISAAKLTPPAAPEGGLGKEEQGVTSDTDISEIDSMTEEAKATMPVPAAESATDTAATATAEPSLLVTSEPTAKVEEEGANAALSISATGIVSQEEVQASALAPELREKDTVASEASENAAVTENKSESPSDLEISGEDNTAEQPKPPATEERVGDARQDNTADAHQEPVVSPEESSVVVTPGTTEEDQEEGYHGAFTAPGVSGDGTPEVPATPASEEKIPVANLNENKEHEEADSIDSPNP